MSKSYSRSRKKSGGNAGIVILCILLIIVSIITVLSLVVVTNGDIRAKISDMFLIENPPESLTNNTEIPSTKARTSSKTLIAKTKKANSSYLQETLFLGDSRTVGMVNNGYITADQTMAEIGICHSDALYTEFYNESDYTNYTIEEAVSIRKPVRVMLSYGINGIAFMDEQTFMKDYEKMIDLVQKNSPDTTIILQAILPVGQQQEDLDPKLNNKKIDQYNKMLLDLAKAKSIFFLDTSACLKDDENYLATKFDSGDGLHFNEAAYKVLFDYILTHTA